jgi:hypothetical protein
MRAAAFVEPLPDMEEVLRTAPKILDGTRAARKLCPMTKSAFAAAPLAALFALGACNNEPEVIDLNPDPNASVLANAAPVEAPPMIQASRTYRCKDNSLISIDYYTNNTATVKEGAQGAPTMLTATDGKPPFTAEGYSLSDNAAQVSYTAPGKGTRSCKS